MTSLEASFSGKLFPDTGDINHIVILTTFQKAVERKILTNKPTTKGYQKKSGWKKWSK